MVRQLLLLVAVVVGTNLPVLSPRFLFLHDTLFQYAAFHSAYSNFYFAGELPRWLPLGYGIPADYLLFLLQPLSHCSFVLGWLLGIEDTLLLFKISMILNQLVFALGLYQLCDELYSSPWSKWMVLAGLVVTNSWHFQCSLNFLAYYLLPLVLFFLLRFFRTGSASALWLAGTVEAMSLVGTCPYIAPVHLMILASFSLVQVPISPLLRPRTYLNASFLLFAVVALVVGAFALGVFDGVENRSPGRDFSGNVPFDFFLTYGQQPMGGFIRSMIVADSPQGEFACYIGLLPLLLAGVAVIAPRNTVCTSVALVTLVLFWFSIGGWFSEVAYHFPLMPKYRHLIYVLGTAKFFVALLGGFGLDYLLMGHEKRPGWSQALVLVGLAVFCLDLICHPYHLTLAQSPTNVSMPYETAMIVGGARALVYVAVLLLVLVQLRTQRRATPWPIAAAVLFDIGCFYAGMMSSGPWLPHDTEPELLRVQRPDYIPHRTMRPWFGRTAKVEAILLAPRTGIEIAGFYATNYLLMGVDPILPEYRTDQICTSVAEMLALRQTDEPGFLQSCGYGLPKLRMVREVRLAKDLADGKEQYASLEDPSETPVIIGGEGVPSGRRHDSAVQLVASSANHLSVRVNATAPGYLYEASAFHDGWKVYVDGAPRPVLRANVGFKAVQLQAGQHEVTFEFDAPARKWLLRGLFLTSLAFGAALFALPRLLVGNRQSALDEPSASQAKPTAISANLTIVALIAGMLLGWGLIFGADLRRGSDRISIIETEDDSLSVPEQ